MRYSENMRNHRGSIRSFGVLEGMGMSRAARKL